MPRADFDAEVVPLHLALLDTLRAQGRIEHVSRFGDSSGGAYVLRAADLAEVTATATHDPAYDRGG